MRPIAIPDYIFPGETRAIIGGENGTEPAEYLVRQDDAGMIVVTTLVLVDDDEIEALAESKHLWLTLHGGELPWTIEVAK